MDDLCITTGLSLNGLLFIAPRKHMDALVNIFETNGNVLIP